MNHILLSISGHDRPGIVRDVAEALLHLHANIEDSSMTALKGRFAMMLIVALPEETKLGELKASLAELEQRTGLTVQSQPMTEEEAGISPPEPDHVVTVHGADKPGIVHAVTQCLADLSVSIVDLSTRISEDRGGVYMMALEVAAGDAAGSMRQKLSEVADRLAVDIEVHELESDIL
jgi:glycine cleavage system transcriptional repressor